MTGVQARLDGRHLVRKSISGEQLTEQKIFVIQIFPKTYHWGAPPSRLLMSPVALPHFFIPRFKSIPIEQKSQITSIMANVN